MKHLLTCPVCGHTEISENTCPNCDADLSLIRLLRELPPSSPQVIQSESPYQQSKVTGWQVGVALLILIIGIGLGAVGSFLFLQPLHVLSTNTVNSPSQVAIKGDETTLPIAQKPINRQFTQYTVKPGDNLTAITEQFCGKGESWQVMVKTNPQLQGREDDIYVGEVLKLPNCEG